ncbi:hypothetical protein KKE60_04210 [Patescibacteria group bacterium]|nr:hypothetical protein [Patescibacteria group bacterium]
MAFNKYDSECPICRGTKRVIVETVVDRENRTSVTRTELWGYYAPSGNEIVIEGFCDECGAKFIIP